MSQPSTAGFLRGTRQKIIAVFVIALLAIGLAVTITYYSFNELLQTVDRLAEPNAKIETLNNFFRQITSLDQELRAKALTNPRLATNTFLQESKALMAQLDTLDNLNWSDSNQHERLHSIRAILQKRNKLFLTYLQAKLSAAQNYSTSYKLDSLSQFLINYTPGPDTSIITTSKKTITTRIDPAPAEEKDKEGFFMRLFGKKKKKEGVVKPIEVEEELSTIVDTVSIFKENSAIEQIGQIVRTLEADKRLQNRIVLQREIQFIDENTKLLTQVLTILRDVEQEELERIEANYLLASELAAESTRDIGTVVLIFVLCSILLLSLIMFDITRTRYYRQQLIAAKEEAENLGKQKQQFLSNMSHEIRTPLQSIIGFSDLVQQELPANEEIKAIQKASQHLLHVVNEVLDFTRIDSGRLTLQRHAFNLATVLSDVEANVRIQAEHKSLDFSIVCEGVSDTLLLGDAFRLRQILYNLLGNAVKFTHNGFVKLHVFVQHTIYRHQCVFTISDSGIGIAPENHGKIFREFEQVSNEHQQGGSGIGLAIVKKLVEAQYGQITIDSLPGAGAVFTVSLGFDKAPEDAVEQRLPVESTTPASFHGRVLVVDDDALILRYCAAVFEKNNIRFSSYQEVGTLLAQPIDTTFTHVLIDIRMPEMSGQQLLALLRKAMPAHTCFVAITAHALPQQQRELLQAGFDAVLVKPFREHELLALLANSFVNTTADKILDTEKLLKITFGDESSLTGIVNQFIEETSEDIVHLSAFSSSGNDAHVRELVHKLAGRCGQIGSAECYRKLKSIEYALEAGKRVGELEAELNGAIATVYNLLDELTGLMERRKDNQKIAGTA